MIQMNGLPWGNNSWDIAAQIATRSRQNVAAWNLGMNAAETPLPLRIEGVAQLLLQAVIIPGARTSEGKLIQAVTIPWFNSTW
jgi:hypothetical protein